MPYQQKLVGTLSHGSAFESPSVVPYAQYHLHGTILKVAATKGHKLMKANTIDNCSKRYL